MLARVHWQSWNHSSRISCSSCSMPVRQSLDRLKSICSTSTTPSRSRGSIACQQRLLQNAGSRASSKEASARAAELEGSLLEHYPRFQRTTTDILSSGQHKDLWKNTTPSDDLYEVKGRITNMRKASRKLRFLDVERDGKTVQVILAYQSVNSSTTTMAEDVFLERAGVLSRGDHISVVGTRTKETMPDGRYALQATQLPVLTSPCLHRYPVAKAREDTPPEESELDRHEQMLTYPSIIETIKVRSEIVRHMRNFFNDRGFTEVQTPILAGLAGGAAARPFKTTATEFADRKISLRIAPELWLKRLVVAGMSNVFEIGPSFRNEGLDRTHNPEFTTCEFYAAFWNLDNLMATTTALLRTMYEEVSESFPNRIKIEIPERFEQIDFIPAINQALGEDLPTLDFSSQHAVLSILERHNIPVPSAPSLANLLDKLSSHFLEPRCEKPTWIVNIPECMSPLSKSYLHPTIPNKQRVSARAELFIRCKEIVNCYEEENSPFEQRRKFVEQQIYAADLTSAGSGPHSHDARHPYDIAVQKYIQTYNAKHISELGVDISKIDEDYLRALEWGLPPTGGWGCGIDRLVMLFTGKERISDVLTFGNLRAVTRDAEKWSKGKDDGQIRDEEI